MSPANDIFKNNKPLIERQNQDSYESRKTFAHISSLTYHVLRFLTYLHSFVNENSDQLCSHVLKYTKHTSYPLCDFC